MADFCAECLLLDLNDQKWGNEYFCPKKGKYVDPKNYACSNSPTENSRLENLI